jgi:PAS domain S-box-containing protein
MIQYLKQLRAIFNSTNEIKKLKGENAFLLNLIKSLPGHIYWKDGNGVILGCNEEQARSAGLTINNYVGKTDYEMPWKAQADLLRKSDLEVFRTGKSIEVDEPSLLSSGDIKIFHSKKVPLRDESGKITGILGASFDVTEYRENTAKTHKDKFNVEQTLKELLTVTPAHIFWYNMDGILLGCNDTQAKAFGYANAEEMIGTSIYTQATQSEENLEIITGVNNKIIETGMPYTAEEPFKYPDGTEAVFLSKKVPLKDENGKITGVLGVAIDITDRKEIEQKLIVAKEKAEAANEAKEAFLRNMRHDLRTPFSGILTLSQWMAEKETDPDKQQNLQCIADSAQVLLDYMNTVLDHAQLGVHALEISEASVNLEKLLQEAIFTITPVTITKQLKLSLSYPVNTPKIINTDIWRLQRIVLNLLGNAVKFTDQGKIDLGVNLVSQKDQQITLAIWIKDTGIGIPTAKHDEIFEKFTRLEAAYSGKYPGAGLGLHDVKQLCRELGGDVVVTNNGKQGSIFTCTLPFTLGSVTQHVDQPAPNHLEKLKTDDHHSLTKILLVEDQPIAAHVAAEILRSNGCSVDIAETGIKALEKFTDKVYDVILMDIGLPDIDGVKLAHKMRQFESANQKPASPIIALTAHKSDGEYDLKVFDKVFNKPFSATIIDEIKVII